MILVDVFVVLQRHRVENNVKKHCEFSPSVEKRKEEVEDDSGGTDSYTALLIAFFFTLVFTASTLVCFFLQGVVTMVHTYNMHTYIHTYITYITYYIHTHMHT